MRLRNLGNLAGTSLALNYMMKLLLIPILFLSSLALAGDVTLHLIPAPRPTNWNSPQKLTRSTLINQIVRHNGGKRHEIGHLYVELNCGTSHIVTGSTSVGDSEERRNIFLQGYGLGVVIKNFAGKLDNQEETEADIGSMQETGRLTFKLKKSSF